MATLTGTKPRNTYKDLLQVSNSNSGIDGTLRSVEDGEGTTGPFKVSTSGVEMSQTLDVNGKELILDADGDTSITADTDDQIDIRIAGADDFAFKANTFEVQTGSTIDLNGTELILDADADTSITADTDDQIDIRIAGADDFAFKANSFEVQTGSKIDLNGTELILDADQDTTIAADTDDQIDIRIAGADDFQYTANLFKAQDGSQIQVDDGTEAAPGLVFTNGTAAGFYRYAGQGSATAIGLTVDNASGDGAGTVTMDVFNLNVNDDTLNSNIASGLTLQQFGYDNGILSFKSSDVSHTTTQFSIQADTWGHFKKVSATEGGMMINGYSEGHTGIRVYSWTNTQPGTSAATSATTPVFDNLAIIYESSDYAFSGNALIWGIRKTISGGSSRALAFFDEDGDLLLDGSSSNTAFDSEDDALLCRSFDIMRAPNQVIRSEFDQWAGNHKSALEDAGILTKIDPDNPQHRNEDGTLGDPMVNITQLQRLHNGAIWQQRAMFETLKKVADEMLPGFGTKLNERLAEQKLPALPVPA